VSVVPPIPMEADDLSFYQRPLQHLVHDFKAQFPNATIMHNRAFRWKGRILCVDDLCLISTDAHKLQMMISNMSDLERKGQNATPVSALQRIAKKGDRQKVGTQLEIDTALVRGAEPSENDRHKTLTEANCVVAEFNQRLKLVCLMKSAGASAQKNEKLRAYLEYQGISTTGGPVGEKVFETMARLDKLLQEYKLSYKLNLIQKLESIDARAYARSKIAMQNKVANEQHKKIQSDQVAP